MTSMRFLVSVKSAKKQNNAVNYWHVLVTCPGTEFKNERDVAQCRGAESTYPFCPTKIVDELDLQARLLNGDIDTIESHLEQIYAGTPQDDKLAARVGYYLFDCLLGQNAWDEMRKLASDHKALYIELALTWAFDNNGALHRLPWEMMHDGERFLAQGTTLPDKTECRIAITRVVTSQTQPPYRLNPLPRILFIVGTELNDPQIRPVAEYLGLLRQMEYTNLSANNGNESSISVHTKLLQNATPTLVSETIQKYRPDVIHFISHGSVKNDRGYIELQADNPTSQNPTEHLYADTLIEKLRTEDGKFPVLVILSTCDGGATLAINKSAPLAAELVHQGVPLVIGMGGRISDTACRVFTRSFGDALMQGKSMAVAVAKGRYVGMYKNPSIGTSVYWAFPALFMRNDLEPNFTPYNEIALNEARAMTIFEKTAAEKYGVLFTPGTGTPVFCGREEFYAAYDELMIPGRYKYVLAIYTQGMDQRGSNTYVSNQAMKLGRTRVLQELASQAIRDKHIPVLIQKVREDPTGDKPDTLVKLGLALLLGIATARAAFDLSPLTSDSSFLKLVQLKMEEQGKPMNDYDKLRTKFPNNSELVFKQMIADCQAAPPDMLDAGMVRDTLNGDLTALLDAARENDRKRQQQNLPPRLLPDSKVVVFLDDIDLYGQAKDELLSWMSPTSTNSNIAGLGSVGTPIPVIITFNLTTSLEAFLTSSPPKGLNPTPLNPLSEKGEDLMAYERMLLHPFKPRLLRRIISTEMPLAVANTLSKDKIDEWTTIFQTEILSELAGYPSNFTSTALWALTELARKKHFLDDATDEFWMRENEGQL